ncbi:MAG: PTS system mannose/fructose/sorbose family transporter subunit IID [Anaerolineae bacterium]|nr:PTS system mannose/fructose/sorbose family transporter subunit IID [Thermoflexales bacterium]MDW8408589.1 PTS system mannose/fructose/sorbose family transporter subunit IID [Anaerolineae bacterium]
MMFVLQALLIGLIYFAANTSFLAGLAYFTTWRPVINGFLVGVVLGEPAQGALIGALINVLYLGHISMGGTLGIGDAALAGIGGATIGITLPLPPEITTGLGVVGGVLLGNLGFPLLTLRMNLDGHLVKRMDDAAARGDGRTITWLNIIPAQMVLFALTVPSVTALTLVIAALGPLVTHVPAAILRGLAVAGAGLSGALGIALALRSVATSVWQFGFFVVGFVIAGLDSRMSLIVQGSVATLWVIALGAVGGMVIGTLYLRRRRTTPAGLPLKPFWLWQFFSHSAYSFERLQGSGLAGALAPWIERVFPTSAQRSAALRRALSFFNTEVNLGAMLVSVIAHMERDHARGQVAERDIEKLKSSSMGTLAGFGDPLIQSALLPAILSTALVVIFHALATQPDHPPLNGLIGYGAAIGASIFAIGWLSYQAGDTLGRAAIPRLLSSATVRRGEHIARSLAAFMLGALTASPHVIYVPLTPLADGPLDFVRLGASLVLTLALWMTSWRPLVKPAAIWIGLLIGGVLLGLQGIV